MRQLSLVRLAILGLFTIGCSDSAPQDVVSGTLTLLTYNVAGLPEGISASHPEVNTAQISPLLNNYDIVLVQEDFAYHRELVSAAEQPYQSTPERSQNSLGDGLNILSTYPFEDLVRTGWTDCSGTSSNGSDCLTPKGLFRTRVALADDAFVDVYNLHTDAGLAPPDVAARTANLAQLEQAITANSAGNAVIVAGDFNERYSYADETVSDLLAALGLSDVWVELERNSVVPLSPSPTAPECENDNANLNCERIDKILYRSSPQVALTPTAYRVDSAIFVDAAGQPLSDHPPVVAVFDFVVH